MLASWKRFSLVMVAAVLIARAPLWAQPPAVDEAAQRRLDQAEGEGLLDEELGAPEVFTETITGEVVDAYAYLVNGERGKASQPAIAAGNPPAILENDTELLYLIVDKGGRPATALVSAHAGKSVSITGKVYEGDGIILLEAEKIEPAAP